MRATSRAKSGTDRMYISLLRQSGCVITTQDADGSTVVCCVNAAASSWSRLHYSLFRLPPLFPPSETRVHPPLERGLNIGVYGLVIQVL